MKRNQTLTSKKRDEILKLLRLEIPASRIANNLGVTYYSVRVLAMRNGIELRKAK